MIWVLESESIAGRVLVLHMSDPGLIPNATQGPPNPH